MPKPTSKPLVNSDDPSPFGVYIHWPFCKAKCPYCDFNSHVRHNSVDQAEFVQSYLTELKTVRNWTGARTVSSIFFGGGTPSLMDVKTVEHIIAAIDALWGIEQGAEITLEANPTSVEASKFTGFKQVGINRVSLGVQSLNDDALKWLGRQHNVKEALNAVTLARDIFDRVSFDLIYARHGQDLTAWEKELTKALSFNPDHLSLYQLTIEEGTAFHKLWEIGSLVEIDDDTARAQFDLTQTVTEDAGLPAYEISNHAKSGEESRHNLLYWRGHDYAGIGPGAHGRIRVNDKRIATTAESHPETWAKNVQEKAHGYVDMTTLENQDIVDERLIMGLRLSEGLDICDFNKQTGARLDIDKIQHLIDLNFLYLTQTNRLIAQPPGRPVLNTLIKEISLACVLEKK